MTEIHPELLKANQEMWDRAESLYPELNATRRALNNLEQNFSELTEGERDEARRYLQENDSHFDIVVGENPHGIASAGNPGLIETQFYHEMMARPDGLRALKAILAHEIAHLYEPEVPEYEEDGYGMRNKRREIMADVMGAKIHGNLEEYKQGWRTIFDYWEERFHQSVYEKDTHVHPNATMRLSLMGFAGSSICTSELAGLIEESPEGQAMLIPNALEQLPEKECYKGK